MIPADDLLPGHEVYVPDDHPLCHGLPATVIDAYFTHVPGLRRIKLDVEGRDGALEVTASQLRLRGEIVLGSRSVEGVEPFGEGGFAASAERGSRTPRGGGRGRVPTGVEPCVLPARDARRPVVTRCPMCWRVFAEGVWLVEGKYCCSEEHANRYYHQLHDKRRATEQRDTRSVTA